MAIEVSTLGITVKYAIEATAGTRPTTGYAQIHGVKSIPEFGGEPNAIDVTPLEETDYHRYIRGLRDSGGSWGMTVNDYDTFRNDWDAMMTAYEAAKADGKELWVEINVPGITVNPSFYFSAEPVQYDLGGAEVDSALENTAYFIPHRGIGWAAASA